MKRGDVKARTVLERRKEENGQWRIPYGEIQKWEVWKILKLGGGKESYLASKAW